MPDLEISTQELMELFGSIYDSVSDADCLLYDLVANNPALGSIPEINQLKHMLDKVIGKLESELP